MTQKEVLESVLAEIKHIKTHMPNGELKAMQRDLEDMKEDISDLKYTLLNPDNGVIVNTNKNTDFRLQMQNNEKEFQKQMTELEDLKRWKEGVTKALWIIFGSLVAIVARILMMHNGA
jgi:predicted  nucleic acid-binding Zn-ribbon protein